MTTFKVQFPGRFGAIARPQVAPSVRNYCVMRQNSPSFPVQFVVQFRAMARAAGAFEARALHG